MTTGYTPCACRDCFEIAIGVPGEALCHACETADCEANTETECEAPHAYCSGDERTVDGIAYCEACGQAF